MALGIVVKDVKVASGMRGVKPRLVKFTFDASYVNGTGYNVTLANLKLKNRIFGLGGGMVVGAFMVHPTIVNNTVLNLRCYKGAAGVNVECANNEPGLNGLIGFMTVWGG